VYLLEILKHAVCDPRHTHHQRKRRLPGLKENLYVVLADVMGLSTKMRSKGEHGVDRAWAFIVVALACRVSDAHIPSTRLREEHQRGIALNAHLVAELPLLIAIDRAHTDHSCETLAKLPPSWSEIVAMATSCE
jgi:hypothetical protein